MLSKICLRASTRTLLPSPPFSVAPVKKTKQPNIRRSHASLFLAPPYPTGKIDVIDAYRGVPLDMNTPVYIIQSDAEVEDTSANPTFDWDSKRMHFKDVRHYTIPLRIHLVDDVKKKDKCIDEKNVVLAFQCPWYARQNLYKVRYIQYGVSKNNPQYFYSRRSRIVDTNLRTFVHYAKILRMPVVVVCNSYCDIESRRVMYELYYKGINRDG